MMGIHTELKNDRDQCRHCGRVLHRHFGGKRTREVLREHEGDVVIATMVDVTCAACRGVTSIFYMADLLPA
jgi:ribosomal protein S27E